ncbi:MAG: hypothetical protein AW07_03354 [Candidatus Accumulibacter sp. SK-11]|nr:MAG: hypothetical protein AW07_03354 [Candidatus Accumulibacter sp. SK-11]
MPSRIPRRAFSVFFAICSPPGTEMRTSMPSTARISAATARTLSRMFCCGTGLIAGPPTARPSPSRVTTPTPGPPQRLISPARCGSRRTSAVRWAPCVASGSSPASLTTAAWATRSLPSPSTRPSMTAKISSRPFGSRQTTLAGTSPPSSPQVAARAAAAEQAPVVKPVRLPRVRRVSPLRTFSLMPPVVSASPRRATATHGWRRRPASNHPCVP